MRTLVAAVVGVALSAVMIGHANAGQPVKQGCVGSSVSALAAQGRAGFGAQISGEAHEFQGVGEVVHALQAGQIPDEAAPNDCN
jgi:hypothetical protein